MTFLPNMGLLKYVIDIIYKFGIYIYVFDSFPPVLRTFRPGGRQWPSVVVNYAAIFKGDYQWGYVAPDPPQRMGYICENMSC